MSSSTLIHDRRAHDLHASVAFPIPEARNEHWEGSFHGETGSTEDFAFDLVANLTFWQGAMSGAGRGIHFPLNEDGLTFAGIVQDRFVETSLWLEAKGVSAKPLVCIGVLDAEAGTIDGSFSVDCQSPPTCGCAGGTGRFKLRRIEFKGPLPPPFPSF